MKSFFKDKSILITGIAGTVGQELLRQLLKFRPKEIVGIDNNETEIFFVQEQYKSKVKCFVGDIGNRDFVLRIVNGYDYVFHTAALKHVILGEKSPDSIVQTNIVGLQNVIDASLGGKVKKLIFTSSDKAVNPTNVMGTSKLMGERFVTATNSKQKRLNTIFSSTRFGNVIGSRGSVFPIFLKQIKNGGPVTLTHPEMTRFVMTISDSVKLILNSATIAKGGEVFVTKMPIMRIKDLAEVMIEEFAPQFGYDPSKIKMKVIGAKPGEKMYEELMSSEEVLRSYEFEKFFAILPAFRNLYEKIKYSYAKKGKKVDNPYNSSLGKKLTKKEIKEYIGKNNMLEV